MQAPAAQDLKADRARRRRAWAHRRRLDAKASAREAIKQLKAAQSFPLTALKDPEGRWRGDPEYVLAQITAAWLPVFQNGREEPGYAEFCDRYGALNRAPLEHQPITGAALHEVLVNINVDTASGVDGWSAAELRMLPATAWDALADVLTAVENEGKWPKQLLTSAITYIEKAQGGSTPQDFRPLTVTPVIYRIWAKLRCRQMSPWQAEWLQPCQHGFAQERSVDTAGTYLSSWTEVARAQGDPVYMANFDIAKAFDSVPWRLALSLLEGAGLPAGVVRATAAAYNGARLHFRCRRWCSPRFTPTNGVKQGCPLSGIMLNALLSPILRALRQRSGMAMTAYADDLTLGANTMEALQAATREWTTFLRYTGQRLNGSKTKLVTTTNEPVTLDVDGATVSKTEAMRYLGAQARGTANGIEWHLLPQKLEELRTLCRTIATSRWPWEARIGVLRSYVVPRCASAVGIAALPGATAGVITGCLAQAAWAKPGRKRAGGILLGVFANGHATHPSIVAPLRRMLAIGRALNADPDTREQTQRALRLPAHKTTRHSGPRGAMLQITKTTGLRYRGTGLLHQGTQTWDPRNPEQMAAIPHLLRERGRRHLWRATWETRRRRDAGNAGGPANDMDGIQQDFDPKLARVLYDQVDPRWQGALRYVMTGAFYAPRPREEDGSWGDSCLYCGAHRPTAAHAFWECPAWETIRARRTLPDPTTLPPCMRNCGLPPAGTPEATVINVQATMAEIFQAAIAELESVPERWRWLPRTAEEVRRRRPDPMPEDTRAMAEAGAPWATELRHFDDLADEAGDDADP